MSILKMQALCGTVLASLLLAMSPPFALCQLSSRPPLVSRPASVVLIATLESLSVGATPASIPSALGPGGSTGNLRPVAITTSWAVPSHLTTFRVVGYLRNASQAAMATAGLGSQNTVAAVRGQLKNAMANTLTALEKGGFWPEESGLPLVNQMAGETNDFATRTDRFNLEIDRGSGPERYSGDSPKVLNILVQAL